MRCINIVSKAHRVIDYVLIFQSINHASNDVKQLLARVCSFLARSTQELSIDFLKTIVPMLVNGTKEKNTFVKANCESALIAVLRLKEGDAVHQV